MDLHEELERRARKASASAADRLGATAAGDALVALVGRRRRRRATVVTGASAACVAAIVAAMASVGPWSAGNIRPAGTVSTGTTVIDSSTPIASASLLSGLSEERAIYAPLSCGDIYATSAGATRQVDEPERWPVTVTSSASLTGDNDGVLTAGEEFLSWSVRVAPEAAVEDLSFALSDVIERDGIVVGVAYRGEYTEATHTPISFEAILPGSCPAEGLPALASDGTYTFHLWVQLVDASGVAVATVIDPAGPLNLKVAGLTDYWSGVQSTNGLPNLSLDPIKCGDPSSVEGRLLDGGESWSLPEGVVMPEWASSMVQGPAPRVHAWLGAPLLPDSLAVAQAFGVVDGVVVAVGEVGEAAGALNHYASFDLNSPCGVSAQSWMDMYVLEEALVGDGANAQVEAAVVFRLGPVAVVPTVARIGEVVPPVFSLADAPPVCGDEWTAEPSVVLHSGAAPEDVTGVFLEPSSAGGGWNVGLAWADNVSPDVSWLSASYAVAGGQVVGVSAPVFRTTSSFEAAVIEAPDDVACSGDIVGDVAQHVVIQAVTAPDPGGRFVPVATWVDPFGP